jgi:hypothetical protein
MGRPLKYATLEAAAAAKRAARRRWISKHPVQWKRIQARNYRKRKIKGLERALSAQDKGVEVELVL